MGIDGPMKRVVFLILGVAMACVAGCGSDRAALDRYRRERTKSFERLQREIEALTVHVGRLQAAFDEHDADLFEMSGRFSQALMDSGGPVSGGVVPGVPANGSGEVLVEPVDVRDLDELGGVVAGLRADVRSLRLEFARAELVEQLQNPRNAWVAMGDPAQVSRRLDLFAEGWAPRIEDPMLSQAFVQDVLALKDRLAARAAAPRDELIADYQALLTELMGSETDAHMREWYERQLSLLASDRDRIVDSQLKTFLRYDGIEDIKKLAKQYNIPDKDLRAYGLQAGGGADRWR